jgi:hypothetical protein
MGVSLVSHIKRRIGIDVLENRGAGENTYASYPTGTGGSYREGKAAVSWSWPLTSI